MENTKHNTVLAVCLGLMIAISLFLVLFLRLELNELKDQKAELSASINALQADVDDMNYRLSCEFDEDYIIDVAKEKLNLRYPNEIIFFNDLTD